MIKSSYIGFLLFVGMLIVFFVLPDHNGLQKPFRILIGLSFVIIYFALLLKKEIAARTLWFVVSGGILVVTMAFRGTIQTSFINAYFCLFGLLCFPHLFFDLTPIRKINLNYIYVACILSILIQFLFYSSSDGRPKLGYEINLSGAYLFLFFIFSDILKNKNGKIFVITLSFLTLSRLLIFSIILFYLVRFLKRYFKIWFQKPNAVIIAVAGYIILSIFSIWYVANIRPEIDSDSAGISRVVTLNDGSNKLRFHANTLEIATIYNDPFDSNVLFGSGSVENYIKMNKVAIIPHNELYDGIIEFGIVALLCFSLISFPIFKNLTNYSNIEYFIPILFYTLILWVRFLLVPSFEMIFILFMLNILRFREKSTENNCIKNEYSFSGP